MIEGRALGGHGNIKGRRHGRTFRIGDPVEVRLVRINAFRGELEFELVQKG